MKKAVYEEPRLRLLMLADADLLVASSEGDDNVDDPYEET